MEAYKKYNKRKNFISKNGGNTPRKMCIVGKSNLDLNDSIFKDFYSDKKHIEMLSEIARENIHEINFENEKYVINVLKEKGDTHGWHLDDYTYALVLVNRSPHINNGGSLEYVSHVNFDGASKLDVESLENILRNSVVNSVYIPNNNIYLMKTNTTLHRVSPLQTLDFRMSTTLSYATKQDLLLVENHKSIVDLYE